MSFPQFAPDFHFFPLFLLNSEKVSISDVRHFLYFLHRIRVSLCGSKRQIYCPREPPSPMKSPKTSLKGRD